MTTTRRDFLKYSGLFLTSLYLGCEKRIQVDDQINEINEEEELITYFKAKGYKLYPKKDLITEHEFNGGLRYDEGTDETHPGKWMRMQNCGRIEDIANMDNQGILAYFHILGIKNDNPTYEGEMLSEILNYFINVAGLDPNKIVLVSTHWLNPYRTHIDKFNISQEQIIIRPYREVVDKGDGSGLFAVEGHPYNLYIPCVSIHYIFNEKHTTPKTTHHYVRHMELAEIMLNVGPNQENNTDYAGIGIERIRMAKGQKINSYQQSKNQLKLALEKESKIRNVPLPKAYESFNF
ncbi:MAG: hypothetical protein ACR2NC_04915 [Thermodesulfobacteriota bacterium]